MNKFVNGKEFRWELRPVYAIVNEDDPDWKKYKELKRKFNNL